MSRGPQWQPTGNILIDAATYPVSRAKKHCSVKTKTRKTETDPLRALQLCMLDWIKHEIRVWHRHPNNSYSNEMDNLANESLMLRKALDKI